MLTIFDGIKKVEKKGCEEMIIILSQLFLLWAVQKHGYKSVPDSIAGLSESGANAEHTGKSCSRLELVVRECGLMLQRMVIRVFDWL